MSGEPWANLDDLVDMRVLQRLQDTFAQAMGVASVTVDRDGIPVTQTSNFCPVCDMIRSTEAGLARCMQCDADGGRIAHERACAEGETIYNEPIPVTPESVFAALKAANAEGLPRKAA